MPKKIFIHSVLNTGKDEFTCCHPQCDFRGVLSDAIGHTVENQFTVKEEKKPRPADLFKI